MNVTIKCLSCGHIVEAAKFNKTPYWHCSYCDALFQHPAPPKTYEGPLEINSGGESIGHLMTDGDKAANEDLANRLFTKFVKTEKTRTLDMGAKYPYLAHCLRHKHGADAIANDAIDSGPNYGRELDVPMVLADIETDEGFRCLQWSGSKAPNEPNKYKLITMVHVFEHMHDPLLAMKRLRMLVADDGYIFLRMPDWKVKGAERDFTEHHYVIHPFFHTQTSILELLVQLEDAFIVEETYTCEPGQRDYILRPIARKPTIVAGLIAKNEERDLPRCLASIKDVVDGIVLIDTGSTDRTIALTHKLMKGKIRYYETYTGASEKNEKGEWQLWDFSKARNRYCEVIEKMDDVDYVFWMDADDELINPVGLKRALYLEQFDVVVMFIEDGAARWTHHRIWKNRRGIRYEGACHEWPTIGGFPTLHLTDTFIRHDGKAGSGESSNARNMRMLMREWETKKTSRTAFYLAQTHSDGKRWEQAIEFFQIRIEMGPAGHIEEWLFAYLYMGRCLGRLNRHTEARIAFQTGMMHAPHWSEFANALCALEMGEANWMKALGYAHLAFQPDNITHTQLWRERNAYTDQPARNASIVNLKISNLSEALRWALVANDQIGQYDAEWVKYIADIQKAIEKSTHLITKKKQRIVLQRPGAIGDILMTLNLIPELRKRYPDAEIHYQCAPGNAKTLGFLFSQLGIFVNAPLEGVDATYYNLIGYPLHEGYPDKKMEKHLLEYFYKEVFGEYPAVIPCLELRLPKQIYSGIKYITIQTQTGWSMYKNWFADRWAELVRRLPKGYDVIQIGAASDEKIPGANHEYMGNMEACVNLVANADLHIGLDSFANHLTHYAWLDNREEVHAPNAVILYGSTQASASGYPLNENIVKGLSCQPCFKEDPKISAVSRGLCNVPEGQTYENPQHMCMKLITVDDVLERVRKFIPE